MKLKYRFVVREVAGKPVAVAVGNDNALFNGMIKLNKTGEFIFNILNEQNVSEEQLIKAVLDKYSVDADTAKETVMDFVDNLKKNGLLE